MTRKKENKIIQVKLLVTRGSDAGKVYETGDFPFTIGRDIQNEFPIEKDSNISRNHAEISFSRAKIWLRDLGSTNGSFINNVRINKKTELQNGDTIIIGKTFIQFIIMQHTQKTARKTDSNTFSYESMTEECILVVDQHNSSGISDTYGDEVVIKLTEALNRIVIPVLNRYKAGFIKGTGDGFLATFKNPESCFKAGLAILERTKKTNHGKREPNRLHIRISLHHGQCVIEPNGDRHGKAVNIAFRLDSLKYKDIKKTKTSIMKEKFKEKDRIFCTKSFFEILAKSEQKKIQRMGAFKLKGIKGYHPIFSI
ncbi:MAG: adenylate/guanylate cyclase domain-containing protein [Spirochaetales bacterium]|nr:adenylate/guanylate cyclase domain-containing protein [Spirochaetales bacterium]